MKVLVAGGAGFLGSFVVERLVGAGHDVVVVDNLISGEKEYLNKVYDAVKFVEADICQENEYFSHVGKLDAIVHLAFPTPLCTRDPDWQFYATASVGTANLLKLALKSQAYFVYGSSISVYGTQQYLPIDEKHPTFPVLLYGANKLHGEHLCRVFCENFGLNYAILRYSDFYGPRDKRANAINNFLTATLTNEPLQVRGSGSQRRTYTFAPDAALATLLTIGTKPTGQTFNVACDKAISIGELASTVQRQFNSGLVILERPTEQDVRDYVYNNTKFALSVGEIDWTPIEEGLRQTLVYISARRNSTTS